jgi:hypothetical protein
MRNNAEDANLPRRIGNRGVDAVSAAATATSTATAADSELSGRIDGPGGRDLSGSRTAATATAASTQVRRTRIILKGRRKTPALTFCGDSRKGSDP